ncbi:prephenate dehydrogenase [Bosea caraganae]|uniref:Prephenate dehydrogenase n=1 Tax=Bosea caraganae TaxID=2763117 RepID=A0A370L0Z0_9HYPH|nr:prephenate dehydrogenase [Bosea caraganae]RDJ21042.1 prephenate dehydrogenase [Bosea caraganae]RDJ28541.1 prephenate dehydrogenase [Bosea caraganae]
MHTPRRQISSIGVMGFGAFGRLMATHLQPHFALSVFDPGQPATADSSGKGLTPTDIAGIAACGLVILAVPVDQLPAALAALSPHLRAGAIVLDVGSVKIGPAIAMQAGLPEHVEIIGTHPLFGPQSGRNGISGLKIALCPIRGRSAWRIAAFLRKVLRLKVIMTTPDAHDREAAMVQGLTHLIAKILVRMEPLPRRMTTASFDLLMQATEMVRYDAPGVFLAIERANPHAKAVRDQFFDLAEEMRMLLENGHKSAPAKTSRNLATT